MLTVAIRRTEYDLAFHHKSDWVPICTCRKSYDPYTNKQTRRKVTTLSEPTFHTFPNHSNAKHGEPLT